MSCAPEHLLINTNGTGSAPYVGSGASSSCSGASMSGGSGCDSPPATITVRMIMQGKEAGSIIGKKGDNVKKFREESGAKINISDSSCPERIVTLNGTTESLFKAFTMISKKFEEDLQNTLPPNPSNGSSPGPPPVTIRLVVPASQCGSLIGKGGSKIKEIREMTGAMIQVASEMLPNSTERTVTISGVSEAITQCIYQICMVMLESPPKGATIPYRPKPAMPPVIFAGGQAFAVPGQYSLPQHDLSKLALQQGLLQPGALQLVTQQGFIPGLGIPAGFPPRPPPASATNSSHEITIPNDLIGCIIGRGGAKINEIRQQSGASIKIANADEGSVDRKVTITGSPDTIHIAQYMINASIEMHKKLTLDPSLITSPVLPVAPVTPSTPPSLDPSALSSVSTPGSTSVSIATPSNVQLMKPLMTTPALPILTGPAPSSVQQPLLGYSPLGSVLPTAGQATVAAAPQSPIPGLGLINMMTSDSTLGALRSGGFAAAPPQAQFSQQPGAAKLRSAAAVGLASPAAPLAGLNAAAAAAVAAAQFSGVPAVSGLMAPGAATAAAALTGKMKTDTLGVHSSHRVKFSPY